MKYAHVLSHTLITLSVAIPQLAFAAPLTSNFNPGDLIKGPGAAVYYFAEDGRRYVFPNDKVYFSWYRDFSQVKTIPPEHLSAIPLGRSNVTYRPGYKMVKITTDPKVYVVDRGGVLRHVSTEQLARTLYNLNWNDRIDDIPDPFFVNYRIGTAIQTASDYTPGDVMTLTPTIAADKGFDETKVSITIGTMSNGFVPTTFTIKKGVEVTWTNRDITEHSVRGTGWSSPLLRPDQSWSRVFNTVGSFDYACGVHPVMQGTINVVN